MTYQHIVDGSHLKSQEYLDKIYVWFKNPAYGRHQLSRLMWIVGPIQIWRGSVIYLKKIKKKYGGGRGGGVDNPLTRGL